VDDGTLKLKKVIEVARIVTRTGKFTVHDTVGDVYRGMTLHNNRWATTTRSCESVPSWPANHSERAEAPAPFTHCS